MKPLTPAQQRVVDALKQGEVLRYVAWLGLFERGMPCQISEIVRCSTINALKKRGVITDSLTLSPEYA